MGEEPKEGEEKGRMRLRGGEVESGDGGIASREEEEKQENIEQK